jgi:D-alanine--poly(phosphoribitol) ligase subunit 2
MSALTRVTAILNRITETDDASRNADVKLFDDNVLDSLGMVELMVALEEEFGVEISPAEIEREQWATPRKIAAYIESRVGA